MAFVTTLGLTTQCDLLEVCNFGIRTKSDRAISEEKHNSALWSAARSVLLFSNMKTAGFRNLSTNRFADGFRQKLSDSSYPVEKIGKLAEYLLMNVMTMNI